MSSNSIIHKLSELEICRIAAGEVVEGPSSVVKELIDNALDAGAKRIQIDLNEGGRQLIRVSDNGCGMCPDDALLCLERHATSKVRVMEDIYECQTHGFRGEAIPSIASVSKFSLLTSNGEDIATSIHVDGGELISNTPSSRDKGTTIEIKKLFYNVPVRRKFQKAPSYDFKQCFKVIQAHALANPLAHFICFHNGKEVLNWDVKQSEDPQSQQTYRAAQIYGQSWLDKHTFIESSEGQIKIKGWFATPDQHAATRVKQFIFINNRLVHNLFISQIIGNIFSHAIPEGRHPQFLIMLNLDASFVDPNVHPQKKEVRLRRQDLIRQWITKALAKKLQHQSWTDLLDPEIQEQAHLDSLSHLQPTPIPDYEEEQRETFTQPTFSDHKTPKRSHEYSSSYSQRKVGQTQYRETAISNPKYESLPTLEDIETNWRVLEVVDDVAITLWNLSKKTTLRLFNLNILSQTGRSKPSYSAQPLLTPVKFEMDTASISLLKPFFNLFKSYGIELVSESVSHLEITALHSSLSSQDLIPKICSIPDKLAPLVGCDDQTQKLVVENLLNSLYSRRESKSYHTINQASLLIKQWERSLGSSKELNDKPYIEHSIKS